MGAGLAGLAAAAGLCRLGARVAVYEARPRVGGRIERVPLGEGWFEGGAEWVDADHTRTLALAARAGLEAVRTEGRDDWFVGPGWKRRAQEWSELEDAEERLRRAAGRPQPGTVAALVAGAAPSPETAFALAARIRSDEGLEPEELDAMEWAGGQAVYAGRQGGEMSAYRLSGGCSGLTEWLAGGVLDLRLGVSVNAVVAGPGGVEVESAVGNERFERAVLALPLPQAQRAALRAGWAPPAGRAAPAIKIGLSFSRPFWLDHGWSGSMLSDGPAGQTWRPLGDAPNLVCYLCGRQARLASEDPAGAALRAVAALEEAWPGAQEAWTGARLCDWVGDPWAGGGFSAPGPGPWESPDPRIEFAGEPFSPWYGFMEGALESAARAVARIQGA